MATNRSAATRYAKALLDLNMKDANPEQAERELADFAGLVAQHQELRGVLLNPAVSAPKKRAIIAELLKRVSLSERTGKLLLLLAERDRLNLLDEILTAYRERLMEYRQIVRAQVTTATALGPAHAAALEQRLAEATGKRVSIQARVDPTIIGGVISRFGSVVYDGSVVRHLERLRERLVEET